MIEGEGPRREVNAADVEHAGTLICGGLLMLSGLRKGGILGTAMKLAGVALVYRGQNGYARLYRMLGLEMPQVLTGVGKQNLKVDAEVVVARPASELYRIWRNLENLPVFMENLVAVHELDDRRSLWVARAPAGMVVKWDAVIINDVEDQLIAWETLEGSGVDQAGTVRFEDIGPNLTQVRVVLRYDPPADRFGGWVAKVLGTDPQRQIQRDLNRFKAIMEVGARLSEDASRPQAFVN